MVIFPIYVLNCTEYSIKLSSYGQMSKGLNMKQFQSALRERNDRAPPKIIHVSFELKSRAHDLHLANNAHSAKIAYKMYN